MTILILVQNDELKGQNLDGIWYSSFKLQIAKKKNPYSIDSLYQKVFLLLDFIDKEKVVVKPLGRKEKKCEYHISDNKIKLLIENESFEGVYSENEIIMTLEDNENEITKIYLHKITPSKFKASQIPDSTLFFNSNWILKSNPKTENFGVNYHFFNRDSLDYFDKKIVIITKNTDLFGFTSKGNYSFDYYKNHFFLGIYDDYRIQETVYHFYKYENNHFFADTFENYFSLKNTPKFNKVRFQQKNLLSERQKENLKAKLVGKWKATNNPIPYESEFSEYEEFTDQSFEILFKVNNEIEIIKKGVFIKENNRFPKAEIIKGKWKIGKAGDNIQIIPKDGKIKYLTIKELSDNNLKVFYLVKSLEDRSYFSSNSMIDLKK